MGEEDKGLGKERKEMERKFAPCSFLHYGICYTRHLQVLSVVFYKTFTLAWPIHFVPLLISYRTKLFQLKYFERFVVKGTIANIRTSLFLALYASIFTFVMCTLRNTTKKDRKRYSFISGFLSGLSLYAEHWKRRPEIDVYCFPRIFQILINKLKLSAQSNSSLIENNIDNNNSDNEGQTESGVKFSSSFEKNYKLFEMILFCFSMGVIMTSYQSSPSQLNNITKFFIKTSFGRS